mmetsp:Transcript_70871/g.125188  ORF Transcript_70871/g.125188 Transcript_70871/m.125188 type:complete len:820 (-) Transcript_70871:34-2493(-)|eukprot:CAMPEP_0197661022 /NCGR_PEP_ID=MMETSP1338-20131121/51199_1 /TAXON_ID=43686 ORGANISM="Pelagodinium beii, Strain RCC1491" /NCGR_SAMPLE_ID=MMETSP1338 /ASSEMBLY_ACC=CAM_ASM_000754 /LENGTH=819 /DNA_ID=CAMNT_0043238489 /DNA_START=64 /DNA_END=2523 /DNA_ORIENTATION=-
MAGTLRVSVDSIQGLIKTSKVREFARQALRGLRSRHEGDEAEGSFCLEILAEGKEAQRTKVFDLPEDGNSLRINKVVFVAQAEGQNTAAHIRLLRLLRSGGVVNEGEACVPQSIGTSLVQLLARGKPVASVTLTVQQGLSAPPKPAGGLPASSSSSSRPFKSPSHSAAASPVSAPHSRLLKPEAPSPASRASILSVSPVAGDSTSSFLPPASLQVPSASRTPKDLSPASCISMCNAAVPSEPSAALPMIHQMPSAVKSVRTIPTMQRPDLQNAGPTLRQVQRTEAATLLTSSPVASRKTEEATLLISSPVALQRTEAATLLTSSPVASPLPSLSSSSIVRKPSRNRPAGLPVIGTCTVRVESISDLPDTIRSPLLIVGLEGHEFRAPEPCENGPMEFVFSMASAQNGLQLHLYDGIKVSSATGQPSPLARILLPLSDVMWPTGEPVGYTLLRQSLETGLSTPFRREYIMRFLPELEKDCWNSELALADCFDHRWSGCPEPERWGAFGRARITVQISLKEEVRSLLGLYYAAMVVGFKGAQFTQPRCLRGDTERPPPPTSEALQDQSAQAVLRNADLRNVFSYLARLSHSTSQQNLGFLAWLREETWHGFAAAFAWLIFCALGFFPCRLWQVPIYLWLFMLGNGLLASRQRKRVWSDPDSEVKLFWREDFSAFADARGKATVKIAYRAREVEPMVRITALFVEKMRNAMTFADGPASVVCFAVLGVIAAAVSLQLLLFSYIDPGFSIMCGIYGALVIIVLSRKASIPLAAASPNQWEDPQHEPEKMQWLLRKVFGTVPDQAEMAHRFVAAKVQGLEVKDA